MTTTTTARIALAAGLASAGALFLLPGIAGAEVVEGNPSCADIAPDGETWIEFKIDSNPADGDHDADGETITVSHPDEFTVAWTSTTPVVAFIMKGGPNADVQVYDPAVLAGQGTTPINPNNQSPYGISHVTWCFPTEDPPVTTTTVPETTTTVPETTTTVPETTTTVPETTTTAPTVLPTTLVQTPTTLGTQVAGVQQTRALPRTGSSEGTLAAVGAAALVIGVTAVRRSRKVEAAHFDF